MMLSDRKPRRIPNIADATKVYEAAEKAGENWDAQMKIQQQALSMALDATGYLNSLGSFCS
jgi:hypothetical protein